MELKAKHSPLAVLCIGLAMLATYSSYSSAAEEAIAIEEVVVTARKRSEKDRTRRSKR
jgi:uncharacterized OsmC-like protein